jgi:hypothetical protein
MSRVSHRYDIGTAYASIRYRLASDVDTDHHTVSPLLRGTLSDSRYALDPFVRWPKRGIIPARFLCVDRRGYAVCYAGLLRTGRHNLRQHRSGTRLVDGVAVAAIHGRGSCYGSYLSRPSGVAVVAMAQTANPSKRDTAMRRGVRFSDDITDDDASNGVESSCRPNMRRG